MPNFSQRRPIVLLDDDQVALTLVRRSLEREGVKNQLLAFQTAEDFGRFLHQQSADGVSPLGVLPCLFLLDLNIPGSGGLAMIQMLRAFPGLETSKIAILSASNSAGDKEAAALRGADLYLVKYPPAGYLARVVRWAETGNEALLVGA